MKRYFLYPGPVAPSRFIESSAQAHPAFPPSSVTYLVTNHRSEQSPESHATHFSLTHTQNILGSSRRQRRQRTRTRKPWVVMAHWRKNGQTSNHLPKDTEYVKRMKEVCLPPPPLSSPHLFVSQLTEGKLRKQLHTEHYVEQQLSLDIWEWKLDKLIALSTDLAYRIGLHQTLKLPLLNFVSYLQRLADQYIATNTYHNFTHATDVLLVLCHLLLQCGGSSRMTEWEVVGCFLAAQS